MAFALTREQILAFRRRAGGLDERGSDGLGAALHAGLQDSMPRAALLSLHARLRNVGPDALSELNLVQVWGPRWAVYVVAADDHALFTVGRHPADAKGHARAESIAELAAAHVAGGGRLDGDTDLRAVLGMHPNALRYASTTGTVQIRWDGARAPEIWLVPRPDADPQTTRAELARRWLHVYGPGTPHSYAKWAGVSVKSATATFDTLELVSATTPVGDRWLLEADEPAIRTAPDQVTGARLLPSGDAYWLYQDPTDRAMLVPDPARRARLWTPRVWPGALLLDGQIAGTWRRATHVLEITPWRKPTRAQRDAVAAEAASLALPGLTRDVEINWAPVP